MDASSRANENTNLRPPPVSPARPDDMGLLGEPPSPVQPSVHPEKKPMTERPTGKINVKNVLQLLDHQHYRCALTGRALTPDEASLDHIVPVRDGGAHVIQNTQILHRDVNRAKSILSNSQFLALCCEVAKHAH